MDNFFVSLFHYDFMQYAFFAGTLAAILAGIVGYFVVARNLTFAAHALGHIGFAGASGALLLGMTPLVGQLILTLFSAVGIGILGEKIQKSDMVIGIILSFCLGLGTLFLYFYHGFAGQASIILFGNIFSVSKQNIIIIAALMIISLIILGFITRPLLFASVEPDIAEAQGVPLYWLSIIFLIILAFAVTITSQVVGIILIFTLLIGPAAIAIQWTYRFWTGITLSLIIAVSLVWIGLLLSYVTDWPVSFWISTLTLSFYIISALFQSFLNN